MNIYKNPASLFQLFSLSACQRFAVRPSVHRLLSTVHRPPTSPFAFGRLDLGASLDVGACLDSWMLFPSTVHRPPISAPRSTLPALCQFQLSAFQISAFQIGSPLRAPSSCFQRSWFKICVNLRKTTIFLRFIQKTYRFRTDFVPILDRFWTDFIPILPPTYRFSNARHPTSVIRSPVRTSPFGLLTFAIGFWSFLGSLPWPLLSIFTSFQMG